MSNGVVESVNDANEGSRQTLQPYQFLWLSYWKRTDCDAAGETSRPNSSGSINGLTEGLDASSRSDNRLGRMRTRTFEIGDTGRRSVAKERMFSSSLFKDDQDADDVLVLSPELAQNLESSKAVRDRIGIPSIGCHSVEEDTSVNPPKLLRTCSARKNSLFELNPLQERIVESSSHSLPCNFDAEVDEFGKGKAAMSVGYRHRNANISMLEHKNRCEPKARLPSQSEDTSDECFRYSNSFHHSLSTMDLGWFPEMQKSSGMGPFPSQSHSLEQYETTKSHYDSYTQLKLQKRVHGLGTTGICSPVDVSGRKLVGFPRFSETNSDLLITKKIDVVSTFNENGTFGSKRVPTKINGNMSGDQSMLLYFGQNNQKVQLQSRSCLNDSEVKEYIRDVNACKVTTRNVLSAETDTKNMDLFKDNKFKNLHSASNSTTSAKTFNMVSAEVAPSREVGHGLRNKKLTGINLKPSENTYPRSSRSPSLEEEKPVQRVKQPKVKYNSSLDEVPSADAGNRWVKRLKRNSSNSSIQGTKISDFSSSSYHERRSNLFSGIPKSSTTSSKPNVGNHHGENSLLSDKSIETADDKGKALLLSHGWIQRWRHIKSKEKSEVGICEPQLEVGIFHKGHLPSIAAMALMAKALTCIQQCELQKKGSCTVWSTKTSS